MSDDPRDALLAVAREIIEKRGYLGLSLRTASAAAGVTEQVARRYYSNRDQLFAAALRLPTDPAAAVPALVAPGLEGMGERLVRFTLDILKDPEARAELMSLARTGVNAGHAVVSLQDFLERGVIDRVAARIGVPDARMRSALISSYLLGIAMTRYVVRLEPLASASEEEVIRMVAPVIQDLIDPRKPIPGSTRARSADHVQTATAESTPSVAGRESTPRPRASSAGAPTRVFDPDPSRTAAAAAAAAASLAEARAHRSGPDRPPEARGDLTVDRAGSSGSAAGAGATKVPTARSSSASKKPTSAAGGSRSGTTAAAASTASSTRKAAVAKSRSAKTAASRSESAQRATAPESASPKQRATSTTKPKKTSGATPSSGSAKQADSTAARRKTNSSGAAPRRRTSAATSEPNSALPVAPLVPDEAAIEPAATPEAAAPHSTASMDVPPLADPTPSPDNPSDPDGASHPALDDQ